nr:protein LURP-one-related 10-like [Tanacetum cinerariifolium]
MELIPPPMLLLEDYDASSAMPCLVIHSIYVIHCRYIRSLSVMLSRISFHVLYGSTVDIVPTCNEDNKDVAPKSKRRRIDNIIDFIRDKYGWSEEIRWNEAKWRLIDADVSRTFSIKPYFEQDKSAKLVEDDKEDEVEDDKDQEEEEDDNDEKEQDDNNGLDDETWIPKKEATSSSSPKTYDMIGKKDFGVRKEDDKKDVNENKAQHILTMAAQTSYTLAEMSNPNIIVSPQFLTSYPIDLTITGKVVSLSLGNFYVTNVNGNVMFKVKAKEISLHGRCSLLDAVDNPILSFQKKVRSAHNKWVVFKEDSSYLNNIIFTNKLSTSMQLKRSLDVFLGCNGKYVCDYKVKGSWRAQSRNIYARESTTVISQVTVDCATTDLHQCTLIFISDMNSMFPLSELWCLVTYESTLRTSTPVTRFQAHPWDDYKYMCFSPLNVQLSTLNLAAKFSQQEVGCPSIERLNGSIFVYNLDVLHEQFAGLVIQQGLPFNHFDDEQTMRVFQKHLQPKYNHVSRTTLKHDAMKGSQFLHMCYRTMVESGTWKMMKQVIAFEDFLAPHSGSALAKTLRNVFFNFNLKNKILSVTLDNVSNNTSAIGKLKLKYKPPMEDFVTHLQTKEFETFDDLGFWKANETTFLVLSPMSMDILSVQATLVASESAFSTSGRVLSIRRTRLTPASLEMCMCLKDHLDAQECKQDKSTFETPVNFKEEILDAEVQANEAIPLSDEEIALDAASSEGSMSGPNSGGEEAEAERIELGAIGLDYNGISRSKFFNHSSSLPAAASATNSYSIVEPVIQVCFLEAQEITPLPSMNTQQLVDVLSSMLLIQLASV